MRIWQIWVARARGIQGSHALPLSPTLASEERPSSRWQDREPALASATAVRPCEFSIPYHGSLEYSDGALHDAGAWSWLRDALSAEVGRGLTDVPHFSTKRSEAGQEVEVCLTVRASAVGLLREILKDSCERFHLERICVVFRDGHEVMEVRHR